MRRNSPPVSPRGQCALPITALLDQLGKLREKITGIVRTGRGFGMILHAEDRQFRCRIPSTVPSFRLMCVTSISFGSDFGIDRKPVVLRRDRYFPAAQIFDRLITAAMPELQFERLAANGVTRAPDDQDKFRRSVSSPSNRATASMRVRQGGWIARTVGKKNAVRIEREHLFGASSPQERR